LVVEDDLSDVVMRKVIASVGGRLSVAVNAKGGFGVWCSDVAYEVAALPDVALRHAGATM
jgi:hypothetical protein